MDKLRKIIFISIIFIISFLLFIYLDDGFDIQAIKQIIQPLFFAFAFTSSVLFANLRRYLLVSSCSLLAILILFYLLQMLEIADWIGRMGFGILFITIFSYLPQFIKRGYIEKF